MLLSFIRNNYLFEKEVIIMLSKSKILRDLFSICYPLASFVNEELYKLLKEVNDNLNKTEGGCIGVKDKVNEATLCTAFKEGTTPLGESSDHDID